MAKIKSKIPIIGFSAYSGTGKTTLLTSIIPILKQRSYRVGMIKHAHHQFDIDHPGKDSYELRKAGADQMLIASSIRWALMVENSNSESKPSLQKLIEQLDASSIDIILVEGFKAEQFPKIELHRSTVSSEYMYLTDKNIIAIALDGNEAVSDEIPQLDINNPHQVADFIIETILNKQ
jgi:molybdopterin-guanine dinucleotide biosynthesis protein MobB